MTITARTTEKIRSRSQCISAPTTERFLGMAGLSALTGSAGLFSSMTLKRRFDLFSHLEAGLGNRLNGRAGRRPRFEPAIHDLVPLILGMDHQPCDCRRDARR